MDLGECPKTHSEALRADFEEANKKKNYGFEREVRIYIIAFEIWSLIIRTSFWVLFYFNLPTFATLNGFWPFINLSEAGKE